MGDRGYTVVQSVTRVEETLRFPLETPTPTDPPSGRGTLSTTASAALTFGSTRPQVGPFVFGQDQQRGVTFESKGFMLSH